jgi:glutathione S-transferase
VSMPVLYDAAASGNCLKVRMLARLLGIEYERVPVDIFAGEARAPEHLARNPAGRTPVWVTDDGQPVAESGAILVLLARGTALLPDEPVAQAQVLQWLFFEQNLLEPNVGTARFWRLSGRYEHDREPWEHFRRAGGSALRVLERRLSSVPFLAGNEFTIADIANYAYAHVAPDGEIGLDGFGAVRAWIDRVEAQPGVVNDLERYPEGSAARPD